MCSPTAAIIASTAISGGGALLSHRASQQQQGAASTARLKEVGRQGSIMQDQIRLQEQQRQDALESRRAFQQNTLPAYTPERVAQDATDNQNPLAAALAAAGARATVPIMADATRATGNVEVGGISQGKDSRPAGSAVFDQQLADQLAKAGGINIQQSTAQAAMQALAQARIAGNQRLQDSYEKIRMAGARSQAINRPLAANNLLASASARDYANQQESIDDEGAGLALAGQTLGSLGDLSYFGASKGVFNKKPKTLDE